MKPGWEYLLGASGNPSLGLPLEGKLKRCFESDDPSVQVFNAGLLFGERGV
ncbi:MAG: hypothetical protein P0120_24255 [Nitrospira sp.]|nr:hypothetical protein [Nitrospira sp.]